MRTCRLSFEFARVIGCSLRQAVPAAVAAWWRAVACTAALVLLSACSAITNRVPAPIGDAQILPADPDDEPKPAVCLPVPAALEPGPVTLPAPKPVHRPAPRPVRKAPPPRKETVASPAPPAPAKAPQVVAIQDVPAGKIRGLLDAEVQRPAGKVIGRAVDAVMAMNSTPQAIIVNLVGFMGVGDRKVSLPWQSIRFNPAPHGQPPFTLTSDNVEPTASSPGSGGSPAAPAGMMNLIDATVRTAKGQEVGHVVDVLLDGAGRPQGVVLNISDSLIHDKHLIAAAWGTVHLRGDPKAPRIETDLDEKQIEASPEYGGGRPIRLVAPPTADAAADDKTPVAGDGSTKKEETADAKPKAAAAVPASGGKVAGDGKAASGTAGTATGAAPSSVAASGAKTTTGGAAPGRGPAKQ